MKLQEARARSTLVQAALKDHPDVNAVGVGEKCRGGVSLKHYAAVVMVERKGHASGDHRLLPQVIQTDLGPMPIDIVETPGSAFHVANNGFIDGGDILLNAFRTEKGTIALVSQKPGQSALAVTNAHVITDPNQNAVGASVISIIDGVETRIGSVVGHSPYRTDIVNQHDVALIRLDPGAENISAPFSVEAFPGRAITRVGRLNPAPTLGGRKTYFYASSASGFLEKVTLNNMTELNGFPARDGPAQLNFARVYRFSVTAGAVKAGHSGAAIVRPTGPGELLLVGILFAGRGNTAFALSWHDLDDALASFGA